MRFDFNGKVAIITGAASGIGKAVARELARLGAHVAICDRDRERGAKLAGELKEYGGDALFAEVDVAEARQVEDFVTETVQWKNKLNFVVHSAGIFPAGSVLEMSEKVWEQVIDVNLKGTFVVNRAVARQLLASGEGRIVNISSPAGKIARANYSAYCSSKAGVTMFTQVLALELAQSGITVNAVCPGQVETAGVLKMLKTEEDTERYRNRVNIIPMGRVAQARDVVGAVLFLLSDAADYITGQCLYVDGGYTAGILT